MFDRLERRCAAAAGRAAQARARALAEKMREEVPRGVAVNLDRERVVLSGRGIVRRFALKPALRWLAIVISRGAR